MDAKLIKNADAYSVKINNEYVAFANEDFVGYATQEFRDNLLGKLSFKNCQAIENGYNLDELADEYENINYKGKSKSYNFGFKHGFQKALEILGDKKFSEEDMKKAIYIAWDDVNLASTHIIESLQQTEWEVEIVIEYKPINHASGLELTGNNLMDIAILQNYQPKLDADGYLILKRK